MHHWQDIVLAAGNVIFALALLPSVLGKDKPALATCLMMAGVLAVFVVVYGSLTLWYGMIAVMVTTSLWTTLSIQHLLRKKRPAVADD